MIKGFDSFDRLERGKGRLAGKGGLGHRFTDISRGAQ